MKITDVVDTDALIGTLIPLINKTMRFMGVPENKTFGYGYDLIIDSSEQDHKLNAAYRPESNSFILYTDNIPAYSKEDISPLNRYFGVDFSLEYRYIIFVYNIIFHEVRHFYQFRTAVRNGDTSFPKDIDEIEKDAEAFEAYMCIRFIDESFTGDEVPEDNVRIKEHLKKIKDKYRSVPLDIHLADCIDVYLKIKAEKT